MILVEENGEITQNGARRVMPMPWGREEDGLPFWDGEKNISGTVPSCQWEKSL
jgi:hypothetical protein